ncbi:hypothetical protein T01_11278 [Trichinella spiralis]|uniref:Uncharacterized protein n=1 Tax=Trichinella spiralis TaxID=6334 RepID=A0A0V0YXS9_TRISP|nr:hypothetical protein T01_11278 [Trichinella spiralis]
MTRYESLMSLKTAIYLYIPSLLVNISSTLCRVTTV